MPRNKSEELPKLKARLLKIQTALSQANYDMQTANKQLSGMVELIDEARQVAEDMRYKLAAELMDDPTRYGEVFLEFPFPWETVEDAREKEAKALL